MNPDYCIAVACVIGPSLFFGLGWYCCLLHKRRVYRTVMQTREPAPQWTAGKDGMLTLTCDRK